MGALQSLIRHWRRWLYLKVLPRLPGRVERRLQDILARGVVRDVLRRYSSISERQCLLFVTNDLSRSGAPQLVYQMALMEKIEGAWPVVLSPFAGPLMDDFERAGIPVIVKPRPGVWDVVIPQLTPVLDAAICNTVDTVDAVNLLAPTIPTLWYLHEISLLKVRRDLPGVQAAMRAASTVWAGSPPCAELIKPSRQDVEVVPYGLAALPRRRARAEGRFRIGVFGSIEHRKGQDLVLDAATLLPMAVRDAIEIAFYGRSLDSSLGERIAELARTDALFGYYGEMDREQYIGAMNDVDAVLVSSRDDTLPLVSLDALGLGRMLLLTPTVGTRTWLADGTDCLVGDDTSARGVARLIERGFSHRYESEHFAIAAKAAFNTHFSVARFKMRFEQALAEMLGTSST